MLRLLNKRGITGWILVVASLILWVIIAAFWYGPPSELNPMDQSNVVVLFFWTIVCGVCIYIGIRLEKKTDLNS